MNWLEGLVIVLFISSWIKYYILSRKVNKVRDELDDFMTRCCVNKHGVFTDLENLKQKAHTHANIDN